MATREVPYKPEPRAVSLEGNSTAILVLDQSTRCHDPAASCFKLMQPISGFLERIRPLGVLIIFTISAMHKGTPLGEVAFPLKRRETEPVVYPDSFDKFMGGELQQLLIRKSIKSLIISGSGTNVAVLYTATTAMRIYRYNVIIPIDGVIAPTKYEQEYSFHQLKVASNYVQSLPGSIDRPVQFTTLSMIHLY